MAIKIRMPPILGVKESLRVGGALEIASLLETKREDSLCMISRILMTPAT